MALQSITNINIDFSDKKYTLINAKQYDKKSRYLSVTCYNCGELYQLYSGEHSAYIRYKKPDGYSVFNLCEINSKGKILVELTEQMLASSGICYADLVVVNRGNAVVNKDTGEIVAINDSGVLSTMTFCIDVSEIAVDNSEIESTYNYDGLNELIEKAETEYSKVIKTAKSWAVGGTGERAGEDADNSKYYSIQAKNSSIDAETHKNSIISTANQTQEYMTNALTYSQNAQTYMGSAKTYYDNANTSAVNAAKSEANAATSATNASNSVDSAIRYATSAQESMSSASKSASSASESAMNAYNYYLQTEAITNGLNGAFLPMGTITYAELATLKENNTVGAGYLYNISDNFVTDDTFRMGAGIEYTAGTNVYYTADGYWDCLSGTNVTGVKGENETIYRKGNVNITANNIGAIPIADIATVDEVVNYLNI